MKILRYLPIIAAFGIFTTSCTKDRPLPEPAAETEIASNVTNLPPGSVGLKFIVTPDIFETNAPAVEFENPSALMQKLDAFSHFEIKGERKTRAGDASRYFFLAFDIPVSAKEGLVIDMTNPSGQQGKALIVITDTKNAGGATSVYYVTAGFLKFDTVTEHLISAHFNGTLRDTHGNQVSLQEGEFDLRL